MKRLFSFLRRKPSSTSPRTSHSLESLEARIAPAAIATFSKGTLLITGEPEGALSFLQTSEEINGSTVITTTVMEDGNPIGGVSSFENVKNIVVKLPKASAAEQHYISMELVKLKGAVEVLAPKSVTTTVSIVGLDGTDKHIQKGILVKGGSGDDAIYLYSLNVGKGVVFAAKKGNDHFFVSHDVKIDGGVSALGVPTFTLSAGAEINGQLLITQLENYTDFYILGAGSKINGNVQIYAGPGSTTINAYGSVTGHFFASAGEGPSSFNVALTAKSLTYLGGGGNDSVSLMGGNITGSVKLGLGSGNNMVMFNVGPMDLLGDFVVGKNLMIQGGKGTDNYRLDSETSEVRVGGKTTIALGGGNNVFWWNGSSTGKKITVNGGSAVDNVNLVNLNASNAALTANFGDGNDVLRITDEFRKANLNGGGGSDTIVVGSVLPEKTKLKGWEGLPVS